MDKPFDSEEPIRVSSDEHTLGDSSSGGSPGPATPSEPGGLDLNSTLKDRYRLIRVLGKGGFGIVYLAHDRILDQDVAIKVLKLGLSSQNDRQRFIFEARTAAKLRHTNIVNVFDIVQTDEGLQLVMEYYPGGTVTQLIKRDGAIPPRQALEYTRQIAAALAQAHRKGIIHRDIKPANIFLADDVVKVGDFGICADYEMHEYTTTGQVMGTPLYMAPEQQKNSKDVDPRSDLFALGMTLYHMVTGKPPRVVDLDAVDPALRELIKKATAYERQDRPVSAEQFVAMIDRTLEKMSTRPASPTPAPALAPALALAPPPAALSAGVAAPVMPDFAGSEEPTRTQLSGPSTPAPTTTNAATPSGGMSWTVVALAGVLTIGIVFVVYLLRPDAVSRALIASNDPPAQTATPTSTPAPTPNSDLLSTPNPTPVPTAAVSAPPISEPAPQPPAPEEAASAAMTTPLATPTTTPVPATPAPPPEIPFDFRREMRSWLADQRVEDPSARAFRRAIVSVKQWMKTGSILERQTAVTSLETAIRARPDEPVYYSVLAFLHLADGQTERAKDAHRRLAALNRPVPPMLRSSLEDADPQAARERLATMIALFDETKPDPPR